MKAKSILQCAALLTGLLFLNVPLFATVESGIVGYSAVELDNMGYTILALPFSSLEATSAGYPIKNIAGDLSQSSRPARADRIQVMDPETKAYTVYRYLTAGWVKDGESNVTEDVIKPGASVFYYKAVSTGSVTLAGAVLPDASWTQELKQGLNLVANPYPVEIRIADLTGSLAQSDRLARADKVLLMDPATKEYTTYNFTASTGWTKEGESVTTTDVIPAYRGFFYRKVVSDGSLTFTSPIAQ